MDGAEEAVGAGRGRGDERRLAAGFDEHVEGAVVGRDGVGKVSVFMTRTVAPATTVAAENAMPEIVITGSVAVGATAVAAAGVGCERGAAVSAPAVKAAASAQIERVGVTRRMEDSVGAVRCRGTRRW